MDEDTIFEVIDLLKEAIESRNFSVVEDAMDILKEAVDYKESGLDEDDL
jgi:hypothetical protein